MAVMSLLLLSNKARVIYKVDILPVSKLLIHFIIYMYGPGRNCTRIMYGLWTVIAEDGMWASKNFMTSIMICISHQILLGGTNQRK
jgi:hypothetical protein